MKVDYEYTLNSAKVAKEMGCKCFNLVSSKGADSGSMFLYMSTKVCMAVA